MSAVILVGMEASPHDELAAGLERAGYGVLNESWASAVATTLDRGPSAVFADASSDGLLSVALCQGLRARGYGGLLFIVLGQPASIDVVQALDAGADDCLTPPIQGEVVVARLRAALRLSQRSPALLAKAPARPAPVQIVADDLARLACIGERKVQLTPVEARLLKALLDAEGQLVPTESLSKLASPRAALSRASLQVHMVHLRHKLGEDAWRLKNCRAVGYRFVPVGSSKRAS